MVTTRNVVEGFIKLTEGRINKGYARLHRLENELAEELKTEHPSVEAMTQITARMASAKSEITNEDATMSMLRDILEIITIEENSPSVG